MHGGQHKVRFEDVCFYFDAVQRDRLDASGYSRKSGEVLALRDKLLSMPEPEFEATMNTLKKVISAPSDLSREEQRRDHQRQRAQVAQLLERPRESRGAASDHVATV